MAKPRDEWQMRDRRLLAKLEMTPALLEQFEETGLFELVLAKEPRTTSLESLDGANAYLFLGPSGSIVGLLVQDWVDPDEDRHIPFQGMSVTVRWRDEWILVHVAEGLEVHDPWVKPPPRRPT